MLDGITNLGIESWKKNWVEHSVLFELQHVDAVWNKALGAVWNEALGADWNEAQGADWNEALGAVSSEALNAANAFKKRKIFQWRQRRKFLFQINCQKTGIRQFFGQCKLQNLMQKALIDFVQMKAEEKKSS